MRQRLTTISRRLGYAGLATLGLAFCLTAFALACGIHCPECDRPAAFEAWKTYFTVKEVVYGASVPMLLAAIPLGAPKRHFFIGGVALAVFAFMLTPS